MRSKEEAHDYRYFPDPDLVPFTLDAVFVDSLRAELPELPFQKQKRFREQYGLNDYDSFILISDRFLSEFFEQCASLYEDPENAAHWINGPLLKEINQRKCVFGDLKLTSENFVNLIKSVDHGVVSNLAGKDVLTAMLDQGRSADVIIQEGGWTQVSDDSVLTVIVDEVIAQNPSVAAQIKVGKVNAVGFLVGQVMKKSKGKANPKKLSELIMRRIGNG
ncbi:MAG: hypothetical protein HYZ86_01460 [Candidatus Omnitrophica bacterium]|nr:hypothetical protein [Candidatus Omnitrophota bacterium]